MIQGLFKTILFLIIFYYVFKFLARLFAPLIVKKVADTLHKKAASQHRNQTSKSNIQDGETVIDKKPNHHQQGSKPVGEYVDFEEVE